MCKAPSAFSRVNGFLNFQGKYYLKSLTIDFQEFQNNNKTSLMKCEELEKISDAAALFKDVCGCFHLQLEHWNSVYYVYKFALYFSPRPAPIVLLGFMHTLLMHT